jgi:hypothetical protein
MIDLKGDGVGQVLGSLEAQGSGRPTGTGTGEQAPRVE